MIATTRGALIRDVNPADDIDALGDEVESNAVAVTASRDFPLSLIERGQNVYDQSSGEWRTVRELIGRCPADVPVNEGDRIKDLRDGKLYIVDEFESTPRGLSGRSSVTMKLRRTSP